MTEEQKNTPQENEKSCCSHKSGCCGGRGLRCLVVALLLAAAAFGLYQAGKCSGRQCAMPVAVPTVK